MWITYRVRWEFLTALCAGLPADPITQRAILEARKPKHRPPSSKSIDEIAQELLEATPQDTEPTVHVFQRVDGVISVGMRTIRAHLKDIGYILSTLHIGKLDDEKSFNVRVKNGIYYPPRLTWIPVLLMDGKSATTVTGVRDKVIHIRTLQGPRSAVKTLEYLDDVALEFPVYVLTTRIGKPVISEDDLKTLFEYGGVHGYGPERGDGEGKYVCTNLSKENSDG